MAKKPLTVSEARRQLPRLIRDVAAGGGPVQVGSRGKPEAVLLSVETYELLLRPAGEVREGLGPWEALRLEVIGTPEDLERTSREIGEFTVQSCVENWDRLMATKARPRRRRPKKAPSR